MISEAQNGDSNKIEELKTAIANYSLENFTDELLKRTRSAIGLVPALVDDDKEIAIGASKLGGRPDTPWGFTWPVFGAPLAFVAQINFADVAPYSEGLDLPESGLLSFFYDNDAWGFDPRNKDGFRVYFFSEEKGTDLSLTRHAGPGIEEPYPPYKPCGLNFCSFLSLPDPYYEGEHSVAELFQTEKERESYLLMLNDLGNHHRMFGYSEPVQNEMESECALVTNGVYCGDVVNYEDPKNVEFLKTKDQWRLLLQINSDEENTDMMWGDAGCLYYWIREDDLKQKRFDNSWIIMQCC